MIKLKIKFTTLATDKTWLAHWKPESILLQDSLFYEYSEKFLILRQVYLIFVSIQIKVVVINQENENVKTPEDKTSLNNRNEKNAHDLLTQSQAEISIWKIKINLNHIFWYTVVLHRHSLSRVDPCRNLFFIFFEKINVTSLEPDMSQIVDLEMLIANQK